MIPLYLLTSPEIIFGLASYCVKRVDKTDENLNLSLDDQFDSLDRSGNGLGDSTRDTTEGKID